MKVTVTEGIDQTLLEENRQKKAAEALAVAPAQDFATVLANAQDSTNQEIAAISEVDSASDVIFTGEPAADLIPYAKEQAPVNDSAATNSAVEPPVEDAPMEEALSADSPADESLPQTSATDASVVVQDTPAEVIPPVEEASPSSDAIVTADHPATTQEAQVPDSTQANSTQQAQAQVDAAQQAKKQAAQQAQAIDAAIASAKANGQAGIPTDSALAHSLGITAPEKSSTSAATLTPTPTPAAPVPTTPAPPYESAFSADLHAITQHYATFSRSDAGYKNIPASSYGGELECSAEMNSYFDEAARTYNVDVKLLKSMAKVESGFRPDAVSRAGATGVMQLMPATARGLGVADSLDPRQNIMGGAKYIAAQLDKYDGDISLALASYNAGGSKVDKYGGIPPYKETQNYVKKVLGYYEL